MTGTDPAASFGWTVLDALDGGVAVVDPAGKVVVWNEWLARRSGIPATDAIGQDVDTAFEGLGSARLRAAVADSLELQTSSVLSQNLNRSLLRRTDQAGMTLLHSASVRPLLVAGAAHALVQIQDVTSTVERERLLRNRRDARFRAVVNAAWDAIVTTDPEGAMLWVNDQAELQFGRSSQDMVGQQIDLLLGDDAELWTTSAAKTVEVTGWHSDGSPIAMDLSVARWTSDGHVYVTGFLRDTRERQQAQREIGARHAAMEQLAEQTQATLDTLPASVAVLDAAGRILAVNRSWTALAASGFDIVGGMKVGDSHLDDGPSEIALKAPSSRPAVAGRVLDLLRAMLREGGEPFSIESPVQVGGEDRWFRCIAAPVSGDPSGSAVMMYLDITEQKTLEAALRDLNATLEARVDEEIAARQAAQAIAAHSEQMRALGQLAGGIAHDFNNVLQAVSGGARLIDRRIADPAAVRRLTRLVIDSAERGASITNRLLAFAHRGELRAERVNAQALLTGLKEFFALTVGPSIIVQVRTPPLLPPLLADKAQLETVLINLAANARDAMPRGGKLMIAVESETVTPGWGHADLRPGAYLRITVSDSGIGMDAATLARASEPFFTTKPVGKGTGLGLAMARGFAVQSGGVMAVGSTLGVGTTITLWLPQAGIAAAERSGTVAGLALAAMQAPPTLLIVDDEPLVREVLVAELEDMGFAMIAEPDGTSALERLIAGAKVDLLITDLSMPDMDGLALIDAAQRLRPELPAILLTGYAESASVAVSGADHFSLLRKPIVASELAARVHALMKVTRPAASG